MGYVKEFTLDEISAKVVNGSEIRLVLCNWEEETEEKTELRIIKDGILVKSGSDLIEMCREYKKIT